MKPTTLKALKASIKHWEALTCGSDPNPSLGPHACALCVKFLKRNCVGCPVKERTGLDMCFGSPYHAASTARDQHGFDSPQFHHAALKELYFLRSLLP